MEAGSYMCILVVTSFSTQIVLFLGEKILINRLLGKKKILNPCSSTNSFLTTTATDICARTLMENCDLPKVS